MNPFHRKWLNGIFSSFALAALLLPFFSGAVQGQVITSPPGITAAPVEGVIRNITLNDPSDTWSGGTITVGGAFEQTVIIPRNLVIDLPAARFTLQQLVTEGLSIPGVSIIGNGVATILANRQPDGRVIAGDVWIHKGVESIMGTVTFINHTDGYFRINGTLGMDNGLMVRLNDPTGRHTIQGGLGCAQGNLVNCSADIRFTNDPDNYTHAAVTGYPICIPSTVVGGNRAQGSNAGGAGDPFCPASNRTANSVVPNSTLFAPIQVGDSVTVEGNMETIGTVQFLSPHTARLNVALTTQDDPTQPDYLIWEEVEWDVAGFQNERVRLLLIGFSTLGNSHVDVFSLHWNPATGLPVEYPLTSTVGNPTTTNLGIPPFGTSIFKVRHIVDFLLGAPVDARYSPCQLLANAGINVCSPQRTMDEEFRIDSPVVRDLMGRTRRATPLNPGVATLDIQGMPSQNGQYLTPVGIGHPTPEMTEVNLALLPTPFNFEGTPWSQDRRLGPAGCAIDPLTDAPMCESTATSAMGSLHLNPFPHSGQDPRSQSPAFAQRVSEAGRNRVLAFHPFGATDILPFPAGGAITNPPPPPPNSVPVANPDAATVTTAVATPINVLANDTDADGNGTINPASVVIVTQPVNGTATPNANGTVTYTSRALFTGADTFTYTVADNAGARSNAATVTITVNAAGAPNSPPVANNDAATTAPNTAVTINVLANDTDADGTINPATVQVVRAADNGTAVANANGTVTYTPRTGFVGKDRFRYTVQDNLGAVSDTANVDIDVR